MLTLPILLAASAATTAAANDADINAQIFRPSIGSQQFFGVVDTDLPAPGLSFDGLLQFVKSPLQYTDADGKTSDVVGNVLQLDLMGAWRVGRLRFGLDMPIILRSFGGVSDDSSGLGDLALDGKLLVADPSTAAIGIATVGRIILPVSTGGEGLSVGALAGEATVAFTRALNRSTLATLDIGTSFQPAVDLEGAEWGNQAFVNAGVSHEYSPRFGLVGELHSNFVYADPDPATTPIEALVGGWYRMGENRAYKLRPAVSWGVSDGVGAPAFRTLLALAYDPQVEEGPVDPDGDGLVGSADSCPSIPEDADGYEDNDGCAEPTRVTVKVIDTDGEPVSDAEWTLSTGAKGRSGGSAQVEAGKVTAKTGDVSADAQVPNGAPYEITLKVPAPRGSLDVIVKDAAGKPIEGATWRAAGPTPVADMAPGKVAVRPGTYELSGAAPGYRPGKATVTVLKDGTATMVLELLPSKAAVSDASIDIKDSVYFETSKAIIKPESFGLLDEVAEILTAHPELTRIRIEGHTDSRGAASDNLTLSQARAESVRAYLVGKGISADRLEAQGYGESKPLVKGENQAAWTKNRRVTFFVVARSDGR